MHFLGIEIGHEATRVVALDIESGRCPAVAECPHAWVAGLPDDCREQDPGAWIAAVDRAVREVAEALGPEAATVAGIGVTAPGGGMVCLDEADRVVRPAKLGDDRSGGDEFEELARAVGGTPGMIELIGNPPSLGSMAVLALWLKNREPEHFARTRSMMTAQDFVGYWLSGGDGTSASTAASTGLFEIPERAWSRTLTEFIGGGLAEKLPRGLSPYESRGVLRPALARAWGLGDDVWIAPGAGGEAAAVLASGLGVAGDMVADLAAESTLTGLSPDVRVDFRGEGTVGCDLSGQAFSRMAMRNAAAATEWVRRHCGWDFGQIEQALESAPPGADGLLFLPYFRGESVPRMPEAKGLLHGIGLDNFSPKNLARAAAEGVALGFGYALSRQRDLGFEPAEIRLTRDPGGAFAQLLADVFGLPVVALRGVGDRATGAAMQAAAVGFRQRGETLGFDEIAGYLVAADEATRRRPDPGRHAFFEELLGRQQYLAETLHAGGFM
jgi:xylulokinase